MQRGGGLPETGASPIVRSWSRKPAEAGGRSLAKGKALALAFSVIGHPQRERIWRGGELPDRRPSTGPRRWAGQLSTERCSCPVLARVPTGVTGDSCGTWDSLRVLGGWTGGVKVNPHDYNHGGFWPFGTNGRAHVRAAPLLGTAPCPGYWWECLQGARVLGLSACGPRQPLDGFDPIWNTSASTAHRLRCSLPPCPAGMRGALRRDPPGLVSGSGIIMDLWRRWV